MKFNYKWTLKDAIFTKDKGKVFSCFACGGGSTMGYKLAGFDVIGANDIDKKMAKIYTKNHNPSCYYLCDIREFNKKIKNKEVDERLFDLDILDGSPPCSTFSIAGSREKSWGKEKQFREGQKKQVLDDLFFHFIETANLLKPKIVIAENVKGLILGNAKGYIIEIKKRLMDIGYNVQIFLLNSASMGVPQKRERVFVIAMRKDLNLGKIKLNFNEKPIHFREIKDRNYCKDECKIYDFVKKLIKYARYGDTNLAKADERHRKLKAGKGSYFNTAFIYENKVLQTITAGDKNVVFSEKRKLSSLEYKLGGSYPLDYDFLDVEPKYAIGMSVPPVMIAQIANQIYEQLLKK